MTLYHPEREPSNDEPDSERKVRFVKYAFLTIVVILVLIAGGFILAPLFW